MKYLIDIRAYHFVIRTLPKILPEGMWNILGSIFFILFMQYAKFLRPVFFGTPSERYIEYSWANMNLRGRRLKILDVGCGDSLFDYKLKNLGHDVSGIDLLSQDINKKSKYNFIQGDIVQAPFKDDAFDRIHALSSIEHIDEGKTGLSHDQLKAMVNMSRILRQGGTLILTLPLGDCPGTCNLLRFKKLLEILHHEGLKCECHKYYIEIGRKWDTILEDDTLNSSILNKQKIIACLRFIKMNDPTEKGKIQ